MISKENLDLERAAEVLEEDHYGMEDVKNRILVRKLVLKIFNFEKHALNLNTSCKDDEL